MAVSDFCMLKKCRTGAVLVPEDRCGHPHPWCDCACHGEDDDERDEAAKDFSGDVTSVEEEVQRLETSRSPAAQVMGHFLAKSERLPPFDEPNPDRVTFDLPARTEPPVTTPPGRSEQCPDCPQQIPTAGPGRASHLRKHARQRGEAAAPARREEPIMPQPTRPNPLTADPNAHRDFLADARELLVAERDALDARRELVADLIQNIDNIRADRAEVARL